MFLHAVHGSAHISAETSRCALAEAFHTVKEDWKVVDRSVRGGRVHDAAFVAGQRR